MGIAGLTREKVRRLHQAGIHDSGIADRLHVSREAVRQHRVALGLKPNPRPKPQPRVWKCEGCRVTELVPVGKKRPQKTRCRACSRTRFRPSKLRHEAWATMYVQGMGLTQIAAKEGVTRKAVWLALVKTGTARRSERGKCAARLASVKAMLAKGLSTDEITRKLRVSAATARVYIQALTMKESA